MSEPITVIALPGFSRGPQHLERLNDACQRQGWACMRLSPAPRWMPALYMNRRRLRRIARHLSAQVAGSTVVVAGHSAGAAAGCFLADRLRECGVALAGVVMIDGVDSPNHLIERSLPRLIDLRVSAVLAPPSPCNRQGLLNRRLADFPSVRAEVIAGAGHGDIEGAGITVYRRLCKDASDAETADRFLTAVITAIEWVAKGR